MFASLSPKPAPETLRTALLDRFREVAHDPAGHFDYPTGEAGLRGLEYPQELWGWLPAETLRCYCGVGNPFLPGLPGEGDRVLDLGSGAGIDSLIAAHLAGSGQVDGLELSPEMVRRAQDNAALAGVANVRFRTVEGEGLPYDDGTFDLVLSNGVINLIADKHAALAEVFRVLRPGGRLQVADQVLTGEMPQSCPLDGGKSWAR